MQYINADFMQMLIKSFFSLQNGTAVWHFSLKQFFTSTLLLSIMNVNAIFYECNFFITEILFDLINKLWFNMIDILASFLETSQFDIIWNGRGWWRAKVDICNTFNSKVKKKIWKQFGEVSNLFIQVTKDWLFI